MDFSYQKIELDAVFKSPNQTYALMRDINASNFSANTKEIFSLINAKKITPETALFFLDHASMCYPINNSIYADIYGQILTKFNLNYLPENENIATILCSKGFKFSNFEPSIDLDSAINLYKKESPFYLVFNDKIEDLQSKFPNLDVNMTENNLSLIDCACRHGSENCFNFLRDKKAKYSQKSPVYALQGGNMNIITTMKADGQRFKYLLHVAIRYHHIDLAIWLTRNFPTEKISIAECMTWGNFDVANYLISKGFDINEVVMLILHNFIILNLISHEIQLILMTVFILYHNDVNHLIYVIHFTFETEILIFIKKFFIFLMMFI